MFSYPWGCRKRELLVGLNPAPAWQYFALYAPAEEFCPRVLFLHHHRQPFSCLSLSQSKPYTHQLVVPQHLVGRSQFLC